MRILFDENMPDSVADMFRQRGHDVLFVRTELAAATPDQAIAFIANNEGIVLVTKDRDFRRFHELLPHGTKRFALGAGCIVLNKIPAHSLATRLEEMIEEIEFLHAQSVKKRTRLLLHISQTRMDIITNARLD